MSAPHPSSKLIRGRWRQRNLSIHDPPEPSPKVLGRGEARDFWESAHKGVLEYIGEKDFADIAAWKAIRYHYQKQGSKWVLRRHVEWRESMRMPDTGNTTICGKMLEYAWIMPDGQLHVRQLPDTATEIPPDFMWSYGKKAIVTLPYEQLDDVCMPIGPKGAPVENPTRFASGEWPSQRGRAPSLARMMNPTGYVATRDDPAVQIFKEWSERDAHCAKPFKVPTKITIDPMGQALWFCYRSDKWHDENLDPKLEGSQEYVHKFWHDVWAWQDGDDDPTAIVIMGGLLDCHPRGIIH